MKKLIIITLLVFSFTQLLASCHSDLFSTLDLNTDGGLDESEYARVSILDFPLSQPFRGHIKKLGTRQ